MISTSDSTCPKALVPWIRLGRSTRVLLALIFISTNPFVTNAYENRIGQDTPARKLAFLVGIADYFDKNMEDLKYAENDVTVIGKQLGSLGFDVTLITGKSATRENVNSKFEEFLRKTRSLENDDVVFIMFSGHGQQLMAVQERKILVDEEVKVVRKVAETPYFCVRDAVPYNPLEHDLKQKTEAEIAAELKLVSLNRIIGSVDRNSNSRRNLLVVDACRNNPAKGKSANITGSTTKELPNGLSILFSARSGQKSWESSNTKIPHGVMSHFLIEGLKGKATNRKKQITWKRLIAYISEEVEFDNGKLAGGSSRIQNPHSIFSSDQNVVLGSLRTKPDPLNYPFTTSVAKSSQAEYAEFLGTAAEIRNSIDMKLSLIPPGLARHGFKAEEFEAILKLRSAEDASLAKVSPAEKEKLINSAIRKQGRPFTLPVTEPFFLGVSEVSNAQFAAFVKATGYVTTAEITQDAKGWDGEKNEFVEGKQYNWKNTGFEYRDDHPVVNVSHEDAKAFCEWLSRVDGREYDLPTSNEWLYAAQAGREQLWWMGRSEEQIRSTGNFAPVDQLDQTKKRIQFLSPVGTYNANPFGIHNIYGNAHEHTKKDSMLFSQLGKKSSPEFLEYLDKAWVKSPTKFTYKRLKRSSGKTVDLSLYKDKFLVLVSFTFCCSNHHGVALNAFDAVKNESESNCEVFPLFWTIKSKSPNYEERIEEYRVATSKDESKILKGKMIQNMRNCLTVDPLINDENTPLSIRLSSPAVTIVVPGGDVFTCDSMERSKHSDFALWSVLGLKIAAGKHREWIENFDVEGWRQQFEEGSRFPNYFRINSKLEESSLARGGSCFSSYTSSSTGKVHLKTTQTHPLVGFRVVQRINK